MTSYTAEEFHSFFEIADFYKIVFKTNDERLYDYVLKACKEAVKAAKEESTE